MKNETKVLHVQFNIVSPLVMTSLYLFYECKYTINCETL